MKIGICGHSGSGKTTVAQWVQENYDIPFIPSSASLVLTDADRMLLSDKYGYKSFGHNHVINLSHSNPEFGKEFQRLLAQRRGELINKELKFIMDRSPVDNLVYAMMQAGNNFSEKECEEFRQKCTDAFQELTHLIYIPYCGQPIEDNKSRIPNRHFQQMVDSLFKHYLNTWFYATNSPVSLVILDEWDWDIRTKQLSTFLNG